MPTDSQNLNSLVDTMSCVVGILVMILAVTLVDVSVSIRPASVPGVEVDDLRGAEREARRIRELLQALRQRWVGLDAPQIDGNRRELVRVQSLVRELQRQLAGPVPPPTDAAELRETVRRRRELARSREAQVADQQRKLEQMQGLLEVRAETLSPSPQLVRLPNPREAPAGSEAVIFLCRRGRIVPMDGMQFRFMPAVRKALGTTSEDVGVDREGMQKIVQYFDRNVVGTADLRWRVRIIGLVLVQSLEWRREDAGETLEQLLRPSSRLRAKIASIDRRNRYVRFLVWSDSFDIYLAAREITAESRIGAGWVAFDAAEELQINLFSQHQGGPDLDID